MAALSDVDRGIQHTLRNLNQRKIMKKATWTSAGVTHEYVTTLGELNVNETHAEHAARHKAGLDAQLALYPPDQDK